MSTVLDSKTCIIYAPNSKDLGFKPNLHIHDLCETSRPLPSALNDDVYVRNSYDWAQSFDKHSRGPFFVLLNRCL